MDILLKNEEVRVLGSLLEKKMSTPDYYPLSLNALISALQSKSQPRPGCHIWRHHGSSRAGYIKTAQTRLAEHAGPGVQI